MHKWRNVHHGIRRKGRVYTRMGIIHRMAFSSEPWKEFNVGINGNAGQMPIYMKEQGRLSLPYHRCERNSFALWNARGLANGSSVATLRSIPKRLVATTWVQENEIALVVEACGNASLLNETYKCFNASHNSFAISLLC